MVNMKMNKDKVRFVFKYIILIELIVLVFVLLSALFSGSESKAKMKNSLDPKLNLQNYKLLVAEIEEKRGNLVKLYAKSTSGAHKSGLYRKQKHSSLMLWLVNYRFTGTEHPGIFTEPQSCRSKAI